MDSPKSLFEIPDQVHANLCSEVRQGKPAMQERSRPHTMTDLVHCLLLLASQFSILINRLFLQEVADLVARGQKVVISDMIIVSSGKLGLPSIEYTALRTSLISSGCKRDSLKDGPRG